jgi:hypothetical protein
MPNYYLEKPDSQPSGNDRDRAEMTNREKKKNKKTQFMNAHSICNSKQLQENVFAYKNNEPRIGIMIIDYMFCMPLNGRYPSIGRCI